ncbi:hypothetical protein LTR97_003721 [Elasticomyces elasticus]|uniref:Uncharacterized protein n=1 Tax=Elasticomyces elasticus TaxID=574655 RepID=A0AAN7WEE7_9PEZI|nr:hypothetical protein LTR97_003721 [Elasticomyces elasticus]
MGSSKKKKNEAVQAANDALNGMVVHVAALSDAVPEPVKGQMAEAMVKIAAAVNDITNRLKNSHQQLAENATTMERMVQKDRKQRDELAQLTAARNPLSTSSASFEAENESRNLRSRTSKQPAFAGGANIAPLGVRGPGVRAPGAPPSMPASMLLARDLHMSAPSAPAALLLAPRHPAEAFRDATMHSTRRVNEPDTAISRALSVSSTSSLAAPRADNAGQIGFARGTKRGVGEPEQHGPPKIPRLAADHVRAQQTAAPYIDRVISVERAKLAGAGLSTESPQWREYVKYLQQHTGLGLAQLEPSNNVSLSGSATLPRSTPEPRLHAAASPARTETGPEMQAARSEDPRLINRASALPVKVEMPTKAPTARSEDPRLTQQTSVLPSKAGTVTETETEVARSQGSPKVKVKVELEEGEILESEI